MDGGKKPKEHHVASRKLYKPPRKSRNDCARRAGAVERPGPMPAINGHQLFPASVFVTKYNGMHWVEGFREFADLISNALRLAVKRPPVISDIAGRFAIDRETDAHQVLESGSHAKVLVLPNH